MAFVYALGLRFYALMAACLAPFYPKANQWHVGRKNWKQDLQKKSATLTQKPIWFHCASYGEYLQALPLIEALKRKQGDPIVLSFFSPSGMLNVGQSSNIDFLFYAPIDLKKNAAFLIQYLTPQMYVGVKHDIWPQLLKTLKKNAVKTVLIAAQFGPKQVYFQFYGRYFLSALKQFDVIFCQYPSSQILLKKHGVHSVLSGDPRFDQALANTLKNHHNPAITDFLSGKKAIVIGSAWSAEIELVSHLLKILPQFKIILAPHEIAPKQLSQLLEPIATDYQKLSTYQNGNQNRVLVIDCIGELRYLYRYAQIAVVGGGFRGKLHNIIEALAYKLPTFTGHLHQNYPEAAYAKQEGALRDASSPQELALLIANCLALPDILYNMEQSAEQLVAQQLGATAKTLEHPIFA